MENGMTKLLIAMCAIWATAAFGQTVPPPCGEKGVPDNVPCYDAKSGKVIHTNTPGFVPHQEINPLPPSAEPVTAPTVAPAKVTPDNTVPHHIEFPSPPATPQSWSYENNASCFHDRGTVQCFETSTLQRYASNREVFEAQFQAGQVVGEAIGALIRAWMERRRKVDLERKDIKQQISTYYNATFDLNDELMHQEDTLITDYTRLEQLDPTRRTLYEQGAKNSAAFNSVLVTVRPKMGEGLPVILKAKDVKYLRKSLEQAKGIYDLTFNGAKKEYVYSQLMQGLLAYYEHQQNTH
jgi:hypothetical protein